MNLQHLLFLIALVGVLCSLRAGMADSWNPSGGHINQALTDLVTKHPTAAAFIADEICNVVSVKHMSDKYWRIQSAGLLDQSGRTPRAAGAESRKIEIGWDSDDYSCKEHALHDDLPWTTRANADDQLGLEVECANTPRESVLLAKEIRSAATLFSTTYLTNNGGVTAAWDGTASNVKLWTDLLGAQYNVQKFGGVRAEAVAMGFKTWKAVATWIMQQSGTPSGIRWMGTQDLLKENPLTMPAYIGPLRLIVGSAMYSTGEKPANISRASSGGTITDVWNGSALVFHKGTAGHKTVGLAARFMMAGWPHVRQGTYAGPRECDWYEYSENESGVKVIAPSCGYLLTSANT